MRTCLSLIKIKKWERRAQYAKTVFRGSPACSLNSNPSVEQFLANFSWQQELTHQLILLPNLDSKNSNSFSSLDSRKTPSLSSCPHIPHFIFLPISSSEKKIPFIKNSYTCTLINFSASSK